MLYDPINYSSYSITTKSIFFNEDDFNFNLNKPSNFNNVNLFDLNSNTKDDSTHSHLSATSVNSNKNPSTKLKDPTKKIKKPKNDKKLLNPGIKMKKKLKDKKTGEFKNGRWTQEEHKRFIDSILKFGNDWRKVEKYIGTRSSTQARSHAQKFFEKMKIANLIDEVIDLGNKTSIKSFHETLKYMEKNNYLSQVEDLNGLPFERKKSSKSTKNQADNEDVPDNFGDIENNSIIISKKSTFLEDDKGEKVGFPLEQSEGEAGMNLKESSLYIGLGCNVDKARTEISSANKLLRRKRLRNFSYNSIDLNKCLLEFDNSEIDELDYQGLLVEMFELENKMPDYEDFHEDYQGILYQANDSNKGLDFPTGIQAEQKNGEELYFEFLA